MTEQEWLNNNQLSLDIWTKKYQYNNETFDEWLDRISGGNNDIRQLILDKKFLFGGRILAGRGIKDSKRTLSNCYVIKSPDDTLESIFNTASMMARTYSVGGGCGIDISKLRPKDSVVHNAAKTTTGPTSFMDFYSYVTGLIGQEGRRGALMIAMDCSHPDIEEFINLKAKSGVCEKANISIKVSDAFMYAAITDNTWETRFESPETGVITKTFKARDLLKLLALRNWEWAEPGLLYWDRITSYNLNSNNPEFKLEATNPCSELPLQANSACLLGSINLSEFVDNPFTKEARINYDNIVYCVEKAVIALDTVLDENIPLHPLEEQRESARNWRPIGLGTFGTADMLIKLGIKYGSPYSLKILDYVFKLIARTAVKTSIKLAKEKGCFPKCNPDLILTSAFINNLNLLAEDREDLSRYGLRNAQILTCAPTGSTATMLETSTGVEPNFAFKYTRKTQSLSGKDEYYQVFAKIINDYIKVNGDKEIPSYFVESKDIDPIDRIKVQGTIQKWIDNSISSTINLPEEATVDDIYNIYLEAWKHGLKGVTVYRQNCYRSGILSKDGPKEEKSIIKSNELSRGDVIPAGNNWVGLKRILTTGCGSLHCTAYFDPNSGELRECYLSKGSTGGCQNFMISLSRFISLSARGGIKIDDILDQLKSCGTCPSYAVRTATKKDTSKGSSCPVAVGKALKEMYEEFNSRLVGTQIQTEEKVKEITTKNYEECPQCHEKTLIHVGGCTSCPSCGFSKCD